MASAWQTCMELAAWAPVAVQHHHTLGTPAPCCSPHQAPLQRSRQGSSLLLLAAGQGCAQHSPQPAPCAPDGLVTPPQGTGELQLLSLLLTQPPSVIQCIPVCLMSCPGLPQLSSSCPSPAPLASRAEPGTGSLLSPLPAVPRLCEGSRGSRQGGSSVPRWK